MGNLPIRFCNNVVKGLLGNEIIEGKEEWWAGTLGTQKIQEAKSTVIKFSKRGK